jgi:pyruvate carboxylase subunit B
VPAAAPKAGGCTVTVNGKAYGITLNGDKAVVNGREYTFSVADGNVAQATPRVNSVAQATPPVNVVTQAGSPVPLSETHTVKSSLPGVVLRIIANVGTPVKTGDDILILESLKMEIGIKSPANGTVRSITVKTSDKVNANAVLATVG